MSTMVEEKQDIYELSLIEEKLKDGIYREYFEWYLKAQEKYDRFAILMQVGDFYEIYGYEMTNFKLGNIRELHNIMDINITRKSSKKPHNYSNPLMSGFPLRALDKFIDILKSHQYVIYQIDQEDIPGKIEKKRVLNQIISPGTDTNLKDADNSFLFSIFLEQEGSYQVAGVSYIDISTGKCYADYIEDKEINKDNKMFNELIRLLRSRNPKEVLIYNKNLPYTEKQIIQSLEIRGDIFVRYFDNNTKRIDKELFKIQYQKHTFDKIYKSKRGMLSVLEYLDFGYKIQTQNSFIILLKIIDDYYCVLLENISKPHLSFNDDTLILDSTTIEQLNIIDNTNTSNILVDYRADKFKSIFQVINFTKTKIGYRFLKERLTNPELNINLINERYERCEEFLKNEQYKNIEDILNNIPDFERLHRKIPLNKLKPKDFFTLNDGYKYFKKLFSLSKENYPLLMNYISKNIDKINFNKYLSEYSKIFIVSNMNIDNYFVLKNIFKKDVHRDLDILFTQRDIKMNIFEIIQEEFNKFFKSILPSRKKNEEYVKIHVTAKSKYLKMTEHKFKILNKQKTKLQQHIITLSNGEILKLSDFRIEKQGKDYKIIHDLLEYKDINDIDQQIYNLTQNYFQETVINFNNKYSDLYDQITIITGEVDFTYSNSKCAFKNNYFKPILEESKESYFDIENMRHPMIEKITDDMYKPFDLCLNSDKIGLILSGINASGKSSLLKTVGILITLAQTGYFVPATKMKYSIFTKIMTRILGNDNILTGSSSYQVEMKELNSILNYADQNTLVLVDELCKGTEYYSAVSLFGATIDSFCNKIKPRFIITTHMHKVFDVIEIDNILIKHISIRCENNELIYDRKLIDGPSPTEYGLMVAKLMGIDLEVISKAEKIRKKLMEQQPNLMINKKSKYNSLKLIYECENCRSTKDLHTHHKREQNEADERGYFPDGTHKNSIGNLQILCRICHEKHHHN